ncbi:MAG TPA: sialate O-acetylesterase, partial [Opitutaceae bacterium]|nr:sialate O-acetylesterase [Opitutaceae bacterium]
VGLGMGACSTAAVAETAPAGGMKIFLLIGQSNMAGRGEIEAIDQVVHPRVFVLNQARGWVPALDPLHFDKPKIAGVGLGSTFGRVIADLEPSAVVGLVPAAFGGTSMDEWSVEGKLYADAVSRAKEALKRGTLAGILWHQGEADSAEAKAAVYADKFAVMIARLRQDLGAPNVPVVVGETGRFRESPTAINEVLASLPQRVAHCAFVDASGLGHKGDKVHFDSASFRELGRRYAEAWTALREKR